MPHGKGIKLSKIFILTGISQKHQNQNFQNHPLVSVLQPEGVTS